MNPRMNPKALVAVFVSVLLLIPTSHSCIVFQGQVVETAANKPIYLGAYIYFDGEIQCTGMDYADHGPDHSQLDLTCDMTPGYSAIFDTKSLVALNFPAERYKGKGLHRRLALLVCMCLWLRGIAVLLSN